MATKPRRTAPAASNVTPINAAISHNAGNPSLSGGGGQGGWEASVEARLGEMRTDIRNLLIAGAVVAIALVGTGWAVYNGATTEMKNLSVQQQALSGKLDTLDAKLSGKLDLIGQRLDDNAPAGNRPKASK